MTSQQPITIHSPTFPSTEDPSLNRLQRGFGHRSPYDAPLIRAAAHSIFDAGRSAKVILEVCCGYGDLLSGLAATFPNASVTGMDQYAGTVKIATEKIQGQANACVKAADVMRLSEWDDNSVDLIVGQATMHHLTHNLGAALGEFARVLRPGAKCIFTFEPLSHSHWVNAIRAYRNAKNLYIDESNLYLETIEQHAPKFSSVEVQCFNLLGSYVLKALPSTAFFLKLGSVLRRIECSRFERTPKLLKKAANFNAIFTK